MDLQLLGKRALVTGATGGIGEATARMLAAEGAIVAVNGRDPRKVDRVLAEIRAAGGQAVAAVGDLETDVGLAQASAAARQAIGSVDILVNNVGGPVYAGVRAWRDVAIDDWAASYRKNVGAAVALIHAFMDDMQAARWGRIINVSTMAAVEPNVAPPDYQASKAALNNLSKSLSKALAQSGVTVNVVSPGVVLTPTLVEWIARLAVERGWEGSFDDHLQRYGREVRPLCSDGVGGPEELAYAITVLASPRSRYINGANLRVDGGALNSI
jgi:NAD(P)-dependent dehydrogenase (short-subunit alcohol dehydrogenase family)